MNEGRARQFLLEEMAAAPSLPVFDLAFRALENLRSLSMQQGIPPQRPVGPQPPGFNPPFQQGYNPQQNQVGPLTSPGSDERMPWEDLGE